jgi:hypothetical protein
VRLVALLVARLVPLLVDKTLVKVHLLVGHWVVLVVILKVLLLRAVLKLQHRHLPMILPRQLVVQRCETRHQ